MAPPKSTTARDPDIHKVERLEVPYSTNAPAFGSDVVAETLSALDIPYIALNPGASYRGLHDSIVNFLGNEQPQMILCLHEEAAVAIAHGYAKVTGKAMGAAVHSNVGLFRRASTPPVSAATWWPTRYARSTFPISRSIPARAIAACTTAW